MSYCSLFVSSAFVAFGAHGVLVTKKKKTVIYHLAGVDSVFDADSLYVDMRNGGIPVCLGTVHKVITLLLRFNLIVMLPYRSRRRRFLRAVIS